MMHVLLILISYYIVVVVVLVYCASKFKYTLCHTIKLKIRDDLDYWKKLCMHKSTTIR